MSWVLPAFGAGCSVLVLFLLGLKWKFPKPISLVGSAGIAILVAIPFYWIYGVFGSSGGKALVVFGQILATCGCGLFLVLLRFWRDPERIPPEQPGLVLSAADGKVIYVRSLPDCTVPFVSKGGNDYLLEELTGSQLLDAARVIAVEMSFLDVHVNRCPIAGRVVAQRSIEGQFISLGKEESPFINARHTTIIENPCLTVGVVQVASRLVRRVESYLNAGQEVSPGLRLGAIKFGSLVVVILPRIEQVKLEVKPGDRVKAGVSVLARYQVGDERSDA